MKPYVDRLMVVLVLTIGAWFYSRPKVVIQRVTLPNPTVEVMVPGPTTGQCLLEATPWVWYKLDKPVKMYMNNGADTALFWDFYTPITVEAKRRLEDVFQSHIHEREKKYRYDKQPG